MKNNIELYGDFFQERKDYYLEKLKLYENGKKITFNYAPLIFGFFWFIYRKMYLEAIIIYLIVYSESLLEQFLLSKIMTPEYFLIFSWTLTLVFIFSQPILGNFLYLNKAKRIIRKAEEKYSNIDEQRKFVTKKGGTSFIFITIILIIIILILCLQ